MKRFTDILKALCSIGAGIIVYMTVTEAAKGGKNIILYVIASVSSVALAAACFAISSLLDRVSVLEHAVGIYVDRGYEEESSAGRECRVCRSVIDADAEICPYCGAAADGTPADRIAEHFATEDPEYRGTDFSGEDYVSANTDSNEQ